MGIPRGEEKEKEEDSLFKKVIAETFPILGKELDTHVHKTHNYLNTHTKKPFSKTHFLKTVKSQKQINNFKLSQEK